MPQGKAVCPDVQAIIIRLSPLMEPDKISMYTGIGLRTVQDILKTFNETGQIRESKARQARTQRALCSTDEEYLLKTINDCPDLYLDELRQELFEQNGKSPSISTLWRALRGNGYTMKKVWKPCRSSTCAA
ncbi:hypothetical protein BC826DRAFT_917658 [Russula brevipes]|nr:hypothetical protein BC826DRAFT_917658 [Russula brevipes]